MWNNGVGVIYPTIYRCDIINCIRDIYRGVFRKMNYFVRESSYINDGVQIGGETKVWHFLL